MISDEEYLELFKMCRGLMKRVEYLEKFTGAVKEDPIPCAFCGLRHGHHGWCETRKEGYVKRS